MTKTPACPEEATLLWPLYVGTVNGSTKGTCFTFGEATQKGAWLLKAEPEMIPIPWWCSFFL